MSEREPTHVDDPYVWLGSQLEHPGESAGLTPRADADSDTAGTGASNRPRAGAAYLVVMVAVAALCGGVLLGLWIAGGGR